MTRSNYVANEHEIANDLEKSVDIALKSISEVAPQPSVLSKGNGVNRAIATELGQKAMDASNPDTSRMSRDMREQMERIVAKLEADVKETTEIRDTINERIADLQTALKAAKASLELLPVAAMKPS